jgi:hypothetical protein
MGNYWQGITWRLALGAEDQSVFEEWQDHAADDNVPLTMET